MPSIFFSMIENAASASSGNSRSPASLYEPGRARSTPTSVQVFDDSLLNASRISLGAAEAPRLYEELASYGTPNRIGAPHSFGSVGGITSPQVFTNITLARRLRPAL